ncbi:unnamed protein product [Allacma fusca]|uniref:Uncharacterized protein n=1 Tax=Allacma fusca TaxID=39272 RepID=A0A8J2PG28_9HEXA|nr:unnamed protein product [Allacma fusca]
MGAVELVSQSASTGGREFLSRLHTTDDDVSEESNHKDLHSRQEKSETWMDNPETQADRSGKPVNYGTSGFLPHEDILPEDALSKAQPPNLYSTMEMSPHSRASGLASPFETDEGNSDGRRDYDLQRSDADEEQLNEDHQLLRAHLRNILSRRARESGLYDETRYPYSFPTRFYIPNSRSSFVIPPSAFRTTKRSPGCLRKCMAQGFLHPSQCHSLC